jgi:hypothetical protein
MRVIDDPNDGLGFADRVGNAPRAFEILGDE